MDSGDTITKFPFLDLEGLNKRLKSRKESDCEYIFKNERSEDYVTWNFLQALQRGKPSSWWPELARLARRCSPDANDAWLVKQVPPKIDIWCKVKSPRLYEAESSKRMKESHNEEVRRRAQKGVLVEGRTEVDAIFKGEEYLIFVEAKLHSRIALKTTHDPERNQIVRNIDCVIEKAGDRRPYFWMFVRDKEKKGDAELIDTV